MLLAIRLIESRPGLGLSQGADLRGAVLLTAGLMLGVYTILGVIEHGWTSDRTLGLGAIIGVASVFVTRVVYWIEDAFEHLPVHWMWCTPLMVGSSGWTGSTAALTAWRSSGDRRRMSAAESSSRPR